MTDCVDPDENSLWAVLSWSTLFAEVSVLVDRNERVEPHLKQTTQTGNQSLYPSMMIYRIGGTKYFS